MRQKNEIGCEASSLEFGLNLLGQHRAATLARGQDRASVAKDGFRRQRRQGATRGTLLSESVSANWSEQVERAAKRELVTSLNAMLNDIACFANTTLRTDGTPFYRDQRWIPPGIKAAIERWSR